MNRAGTLPLGVDIGRKRVRVAMAERRAGEPPRLIAVAAHDHSGDPVGTLHAALDDLGTRERRCILAISAPDAVLCNVAFPAMPSWERANAARFEAARLIDYPIAEAAVSLAKTRVPQRWAIGVARRSALTAALSAAKHAGLRPLAIDDAAFALHRAHPEAGAVIDIGDAGTRLTVFGGAVPYVACIPLGGEYLTTAIAQALGIDAAAAEARKCRLGFAGAGESGRDALIAALREALADARGGGCADIGNIVLCGNGSRIAGLDESIERAVGHRVRQATLGSEISDSLPPDVLRAAAPDWSVAYGLALWSIAS